MFTRPHRVSHLTFLFYSLDLLHKVTYIFWALTCLVALPSYTALVSSFCTSSQDFDTHFLHFHLTMDSLCFSMWLAIYTSTTDFHRLVKRHACRTKKIVVIFKLLFFIILSFIIFLLIFYFWKILIDSIYKLLLSFFHSHAFNLCSSKCNMTSTTVISLKLLVHLYLQ